MKINNDHNIKNVLEYDPMEEARKLVGEEGMSSLGLGLMQIKRKEINALAEAEDDTTHNGTTFRDLERRLRQEEFSLQLRVPFLGKGYGNEPVKHEEFVIYASEDGIVAKMESHNGADRSGTNGGVDFYFNILIDRANRANDLSFSGGYEAYDPETGKVPILSFKEKDEWWAAKKPIMMYGHLVAREFMHYNLRKIREHKLICPWAMSQHLWFINYSETKSSSGNPIPFEYYDEVNLRRLREGGPLLQKICAVCMTG